MLFEKKKKKKMRPYGLNKDQLLFELISRNTDNYCSLLTITLLFTR